MKKQKTLHASLHACVGVPFKVDVKRNVHPCAASRMTNIMSGLFDFNEKH